MRAGEILDDRYALERELGRGGMGVVWAARDRTNGTRVAVKLLLDEGLSETNLAHEKFKKELRQRMKREAEACMKLAHHPNVVRVFDFSMKDTPQHGPYIVMELLEGESLQDHLKRKRTLEPKLAARITADVASCLTTAHEAKLIHRDLKPANIYLHREHGMAEDEFVTKVLDFGVCKDGDSVEIASDHTPTMTGMVLGSIAYMSPQQAMGSKAVDFRTDIWSVGVVLYELLTGLRAFAGGVNDIIALYTPILVGKATTPVPAPSSRMRNIPPELDAVVEKCTKPKPADRYASAEELARDLYAIAGLPMPEIPAARPSSSGKAPGGGRELIDLYEPAIIASKAVPSADEERRFSQVARTIPLSQGFGPKAIAPVVVEKEVPPTTLPVVGVGLAGQTNAMDTSDTDATLRMPAKNALPVMARPALLKEPPADGAVRTQYLSPDAPVASPMLDLNEMHQALAEHRKSSLKIPIPDLSELEASGGTQMMVSNGVPSPKPVEPSATTSAVMSQVRTSQPSDAAGTTGRRRRKNGGLLVLIGGGIGAALLLVIVVALKHPGNPPQPPGPTPDPPPPTASASSTTKEPQPIQPVKENDTVEKPAPERPVKEDAPTAPNSTTNAPTPPNTSPAPTTTTAKPLGTKPKCTGTGIFKRCK